MAKISNLIKSDFLKNSLVLVTGAGLSQAIPMIFSPVLTRIFDPTAFASFSLFVAVSTILGLVASGLYELSIVKAQKLRSAYHILALIIILALAFSLVLMLGVSIYLYYFRELFNMPLSNVQLLILPLAVFFAAVFQGFIYWLNRNKAYANINKVKLSQAIFSTFFSIVFGFVGLLKDGLIIGLIIGNAIATFPIILFLLKTRGGILKKEIISVAAENKDFPRLMLPSSLINTIASYCPLFFITHYFTAFETGNFSLATRILTAPVAIISVAIGQIYFKKMADIVNYGSDNVVPNFLKTTKTLVFISFFLFLPFFFFGTEIFKVIFGSEWAVAGTFVTLLCFGSFVKFVASPLSSALLVIGKLKAVSAWQISYFICILSTFTLGRNLAILDLIKWYVLIDILMYMVYLGLIYINLLAFDTKRIKNFKDED